MDENWIDKWGNYPHFGKHKPTIDMLYFGKHPYMGKLHRYIVFCINQLVYFGAT